MVVSIYKDINPVIILFMHDGFTRYFFYIYPFIFRPAGRSAPEKAGNRKENDLPRRGIGEPYNKIKRKKSTRPDDGQA